MHKRFRRRVLSMTSLVDVIFLLLLFFMLTSTFSRFSEIEISTAVAGVTGGAATNARFLQVDSGSVRLDGFEVEMGALRNELEGARVFVSLTSIAAAQDLVDVLAALRAVPDLTLTVLQ